MKSEMVFTSKKMSYVAEVAKKAAAQDITILIQGESGTGKGVVADYIYKNSKRKSKPFIEINCGAIPEKLLESELFGYEGGAFTGAKEEGKVGIFQAADGGTLFLDEIGTIPLHLQIKLLRVIQEKEVMPIGGSEYIPVDVRIIAATNINLKQAVETGRFREDLFYRLNVIPLVIEPLRNRKADIYPLVKLFLKEYNKKYEQSKTISDDAWKAIIKYQWPGNVRELENTIERLVVTVERHEIDSRDVELLLSNFEIEGVFEPSVGLDLKGQVERFEKQFIASQMPYYNSSRELAEALGINKSTLTRKIKKYNIKNIYVE